MVLNNRRSEENDYHPGDTPDYQHVWMIGINVDPYISDLFLRSLYPYVHAANMFVHLVTGQTNDVFVHTE